MAIVTPSGAAPQLAEAVAQKLGQPGTNDGAQGSAPAVATPDPLDEKLSPKFAALAKRERMLRERVREFEEREKKLKDSEDARSSSMITKDRLKQSPMEVLLENGVTYEQLTNEILNQGNRADPVFIKLQQELKEIKEAQAQTSSKFEDTQKQQYDQAVNQISREVKLLTDSDPRFKSIKAMGMQEAVVEYIKDKFESDGYLMSEEEAAVAVEKHLYDEFDRIRLQLVPPEPTPEPEAPPAPQRQQPQVTMQTLSNTAAQATASRGGRMSERERVERAKLAFRGQLK